MHKRGQVTVFVILGILIVIILGVVFFLYGERLKIQTEEEVKFDASSVETIKIFIQDCIDQTGEEALNLIGKQGGEINPGFYQNWNCVSPNNCDKVSYACFTTEYSSCYNKKPFFKEFVEQELETYLKNNINSCIDLDKIRSSGYDVQAGNLDLDLEILDYNTIVDVNYPITITKGDSVLNQNKFTKTFNVPLGRLIQVAEDIVKAEINNPQGYVDTTNYVLAKNGEIQLEHQTYSNAEIYIANVRNNPYIFQFAVQNYVRLV